MGLKWEGGPYPGSGPASGLTPTLRNTGSGCPASVVVVTPTRGFLSPPSGRRPSVIGVGAGGRVRTSEVWRSLSRGLGRWWSNGSRVWTLPPPCTPQSLLPRDRSTRPVYPVLEWDNSGNSTEAHVYQEPPRHPCTWITPRYPLQFSTRGPTTSIPSPSLTGPHPRPVLGVGLPEQSPTPHVPRVPHDLGSLPFRHRV